MTLNEWQTQLQQAADLPVNHISAYCLTVEDKTMLGNKVKKKLITVLEDEQAQEQFLFADDFLTRNGFLHYEISNYAKANFESKHNSSYWEKKPYIGLGPSAHSYNLNSRQWNVSSSKMYIDAIAKEEIPSTMEELTTAQQFNEYLMVSLRTAKGVDATHIKNVFGDEYHDYFLSSAQKFILSKHIIQNSTIFTIDKKHWFAADNFIAELFYSP